MYESDSDDNDNDLFQNTNHCTTGDIHKKLTFTSFGYKNGAPGDSYNFNIQAKVANPPNSLRKNRTGLDKELQTALFQNTAVEEVFAWLVSEILSILKKDENEENTIEIGIGCHSGKHRSVAFVERLAIHPWSDELKEEIDVIVIHRDIHGALSKPKKSIGKDKRDEYFRD